MALTFTDWEHCDDPDNPTLDWTDVDAIRGRLPYRYLEALRQARNERMSALNLGTVAEINKGDVFTRSMLGSLATAPGNYNHFVNHTDNAGNWNGAAYAPPYWSSATVLAAIGESQFVPLPPLGGLWNLAEWLYQQKQILDLCLWTKRGAFAAEKQSKYAYHQGHDWAGLVADYIACPWTPAIYSNFEVQSLGRKDRPNHVPYSEKLDRLRCKATVNSIDTSQQSTIDWYTMVGPDSYNQWWAGLGWRYWIFNDQGEPIFPAKCWGFQVDDGPSDLAIRTSDYVSLADAVPPEPPDPEDSEMYGEGWTAGDSSHPSAAGAIAVLKWDVVDGFIFK